MMRRQVNAKYIRGLEYTERPMIVVGRMSLRPRNIMMDQMYLRDVWAESTADTAWLHTLGGGG